MASQLNDNCLFNVKRYIKACGTELLLGEYTGNQRTRKRSFTPFSHHDETIYTLFHSFHMQSELLWEILMNSMPADEQDNIGIQHG